MWFDICDCCSRVVCLFLFTFCCLLWFGGFGFSFGYLLAVWFGLTLFGYLGCGGFAVTACGFVF